MLTNLFISFVGINNVDVLTKKKDIYRRKIRIRIQLCMCKNILLSYLQN